MIKKGLHAGMSVRQRKREKERERERKRERERVREERIKCTSGVKLKIMEKFK